MAQPGSALHWGCRGRRFKSCRPDHLPSPTRVGFGRWVGFLRKAKKLRSPSLARFKQLEPLRDKRFSLACGDFFRSHEVIGTRLPVRVPWNLRLYLPTVAEERPVESTKKIRRSPRGILRWLVRLVGLSAIVIAGILLLVAIISSIAYLNRARIVNRTLAVLVEPFRVSVGEIEIHRLGEVRITDLRLTPRGAPDDAILASIPETVITYRFGELREIRKLHTIVLRGAAITLDDEILTALATPPPARGETGEAAAPFNLGSLSFFTDSFTIRDSPSPSTSTVSPDSRPTGTYAPPAFTSMSPDSAARASTCA